MIIWETIGTIIAGLGLFFSGVKIVSSGMKKMTSRRFRVTVSRWTGNPLLGAIWGFFSGAVSQSSSNTAFILVSLINAGLVKVRNALPIVAWSNVGTTLLLFLVAIDLKLAILILLGLSGIFFGFDKGSKREHLIAAVFGIAMLLFGFQLLKSGSKPFADLEFVRAMFSYTANSYILPVLVGAVLRMLIHSSSTVTVLIMTISHGGLISINEVLLMIYGMSIGEGLIVYLLSSVIKGTPKQIVLYKVFEAIAGAIIMVSIYAIETGFNLHFLNSLIKGSNIDIASKAAFTFLAAKSVPALFMTAFMGPIYRLLKKLSPATTEENLAKPIFISEQSIRDPETSILLAEKEQSRVISNLHFYLEAVMPEFREKVNAPIKKIHEGLSELNLEIDSYLARIVNLELTHETSETFINIQNRQNIISEMESSVYSLVSDIQSHEKNQELSSLVEQLLEALHANLMTFSEAVQNMDEFDLKMVLEICDDKGPLMENIRKSYLSGENTMTGAEKARLLFLTDNFQRIIWLEARMAKILLPHAKS